MTIENQTLTLRIQIYPNEHQANLFRQTQTAFIQACQYTSDYIFDTLNLNQREINDALYYKLREQFNLPAQMAQSVIRVVIARYKTVRTQLSQSRQVFQDPYTKRYEHYRKDLSHLTQAIQFKEPVVALVRNRMYSLVDNETHYSIGTLQGRQKVSFSWDSDNPYFQQFESSDWTFGQADLLEINGKWHLHISATRQLMSFDKERVQHVVGIDRGLRQALTTYDEQDRTQFFSGKKISQTRRYYKERRRSLQKLGTRSSKRKLKALGQQENRWMRDVNHQLSKALVDTYGPNTLFVLEDLTNITWSTVKNRRKENRYEHHSWSFYEFEQFLTYKAQSVGSQVIKVSARYTSQRCPKCGLIKKEHRDYKNSHYTCSGCGYQSNDDRVAAMNLHELGKRYISGNPSPHFTKLTSNA